MSAIAGKTPVTALPPWEAAKRLRLVLNSLRHKLSTDVGAGNPYKPILASIKMHKTDADYWRVNAGQHLNDLALQLEAVELALKQRTTKPGLDAMAVIREKVGATRIAHERIEALDSNMRHIAQNYFDNWQVPVDDDSEEKYDDDGNLIYGTPRELAKEAYQLCQSFPTFQEAPKTAAENTLRAIIALLRHHRWAGTETLTQADVLIEEVKKNGEGQSEEGLSDALSELAAVAGSPEPVGPEPDKYSDEDEPDADE